MIDVWKNKTIFEEEEEKKIMFDTQRIWNRIFEKKVEAILISSVVMPLTCDDWNALSTKYLFKVLFLTKY
jgi:hypothetical protein